MNERCEEWIGGDIETEDQWLCGRKATRFYCNQRNRIVCKCYSHRLYTDDPHDLDNWKEITYEDAIIIWVHRS
jgi:hypothetical protein